MKKIALIGDSISHSLSPKLFKAAYSHTAEEFSYDLLDYPTIKEAMDIFESQGYLGANITSPYKKEVISYCKELDPTSQETGAVNLILKQENGLKGYNTDCQGVFDPLKKRGILPCNVIVIGAGGAARAAIYILKKEGYFVTIVNRTLEKAKDLAQEYNVKWAAIENLKLLFNSNELLVYTIGTYLPSIESSTLNNIIIFEANYKMPSLIDCSCKEYIPGTEWLVYQAIPSFRLFTDKEPHIYAMLKLTNSY